MLSEENPGVVLRGNHLSNLGSGVYFVFMI
jgi:hypothetical protein